MTPTPTVTPQKLKIVILSKKHPQIEKVKHLENIADESVRPGLVDCDKKSPCQGQNRYLQNCHGKARIDIFKITMPRPESIFNDN